MKRSRSGNVSVGLLVGLGLLLVVAAGFFYIYRRNLARYAKGPRAVSHQRLYSSRTVVAGRLPELLPVPLHQIPVLEPTFTIIGPVGNRKIIQKVMPSYPLWAEEQGVSAQVRLAFRVNDEGNVAPNVWITQMGYPDFDAAAVQALKQWKFEPLDHPVPLPPEPNVVKDVDRGQPAVIDFTFKMAKSPVRI